MKELSQEAREARNAYQRQWRAKNRERVRETERRFWERKAARQAADSEPVESGGGDQVG